MIRDTHWSFDRLCIVSISWGLWDVVSLTDSGLYGMTLSFS